MSVTTVPILPVEKGSLAKLWGGVALAVLIAGGAAWWGTRVSAGDCSPKAFAPEGKGVSAVETTATGLHFQTVKAGQGAKPTDEDIALVGYKGTLTNGTVFDQQPQAPFPVKDVVPGFSEALKMMQRGGSYKICIPPAIGYGARANSQIPANSTLHFDVELLDFRSIAEVQQMQQMQQQMQLQQQLQQQQGGAQPAPPSGH